MGANYLASLASQSRAGTLLNTYTTAKRVINDEDVADLPRGFWKAGRRVHMHIRGALSNIVTTPGTIQFLVKLGTEASPITVFDSGAVQLNAIAHTALPFWLDIFLRADKDNFGSGTTAKLMGTSRAGGVMLTKTAGQVDGVNSDAVLVLPAAGNALGAGFNAAVVNTLDFWTGFSISNAGNGIRIDDYSVIDMGVSAT